jgi:proline dehydrogenase
METTQGISLYSYFYLKLAKHNVFLIFFYVFSSGKSESKKEEQVLHGVGGRGGPNNVFTCK